MKKQQSQYGFNTLAVHAGTAPDPTTGARSFPIFQTSSYVFDDADHAASLFNLQAPGFIYSRLTNPTVSALEEKLATLEGGRGGTVTSSGHAAETLALFPLMAPGMEVIVADKLYGGTINLMGKSYRKFGWNAVFVDTDNPEGFRRAVTEKTRAIFIENLANPGGVVADLEAIAKVANEAGVPMVVDNTMATPFLSQPFEWGADIVVHSTTKFLSGQGNALGGVVIDSGKFPWLGNSKYPSLSEPSPEYNGLTFAETFGDLAYTMYSHAISLRDLGCSQSPMNAWITLNGIETLPLRIERHCSNALAVAQFLEKHPSVEWVSHAGLESSPYYELGKKYLPDGTGSVFTFGVKGGYESGLKMLETVELFSHVANIGDTHSLILHPASTTHRQLSEEQLITAGAGPEVIRLSIGIECAEDLIADLEQALKRL
ncbi:MAG: aminotransferase class I/II-fold pyridoxal phosphate-dependent enzyme [SAR324 cluster bacterium]|jgi:O-acetylhomoserine (thiol)-lyase|nr:aminotransferase class I/II-fold pyridoxal phosphate-dependent enzyme [SAR324 cluster bacterium]MDP7439753.1 aminotransferase class I/II-fold pyridoxal phosphate-dependent enzyme [SAR324 cluster bacterium]MDP7583589.1 aminotransferase class I/II-fold pyridoxal phosphate-dependent enzyme [SAR324 cluster bacterium]